MKKLKNYYMHLRHHHHSHHHHAERKWVFPLAVGSLISLFLLFVATLTSSAGTPLLPFYRSLTAASYSVFVESRLRPLPVPSSSSLAATPPPPRLAYLISGSAGDGAAALRVLLAVYHPENRYVVHLDREASAEERADLVRFVEGHAVFRRFGNVRVMKKANLVTYRGPTMRARPIIVDPGLYMNKKQDVFWVTQRRSRPTAFKLFTGSAWMALSKSFIDYCIWGWDNLPRTVLMYYSNFISSPEGYFHTVICNAQEFRNTTVNSDLHFISWDNPPKQHPHYLTLEDMGSMVGSNAPFARKFHRDDPVLDKIDSQLLSRGSGMTVPGGWCIGSRKNGTDPCSEIGDTTVLRPGDGSKRLEKLISSLLSNEKFRPRQCV
ncbi:hypothetical protein Fmac_016779 [Flemingia macrophylla]|uniref:Uncharacterized protein n=1 Tax=Flemingia macrophylla TaxID=520843 RepID=A0ABD1MIM3_9FABA